MVAWLTSLFNKGGAKAPQQSVGRSTKQDFTSVMQTVVEETILATAYWLIRFVNKTLETRAIAQTQSPNKVEEKRDLENPSGKTKDDTSQNDKTKVDLEELLLKIVGVGTSIEQLHGRDQSMLTLESRIHEIETSLEQHKIEQTVNNIAKQFIADDLEPRFSRAEKLTEQVGDLLLGKIGFAVENTTRLENRISYLEQCLRKYSAIAKVLQQQDQTIKVLQYRLAQLESSQTEAARTFYKSPVEVR
jgi:prefoldin subunit 5